MGFFKKRRVDKVESTSQGEFRVQPLLSYQTAVLQGIGKREDQQDDYLTLNSDDVVSIKKNGLFAVVADGMGGMRGGSLASKIVTFEMGTAFERMDRESDLSIQLEEAVYRANDAVVDELNSAGGSTVVACLIYDEKLYCASVGDSAIFLMRKGQLSQLNREQNLQTRDYSDTVRAGSMDPNMTDSGGNKAALTHYMGMIGLNDVDLFLRPMKLMDGDVLLICSDGISGFISADDLAESLDKGSPRDICSSLEDKIFIANKRYQDNYTAIVIQCKY